MIDPRLKPLSEVTLDPAHREIVVGVGEELRIDVNVEETPKGAFAIVLQEGASFTMVTIGEARSDVSIARSIDCVGSNVTVRLLSAVRGCGSAQIALDSHVRVRSNASNCAIDERLIIDDAARSIVRHRVVVDRSVVDSAVSSSVRGMMLGEKSFVRAIPELDVCSNMVKAQHAVALSRPKPESIAYFAAQIGRAHV